jgi:hypothetical protein
MGTLDAALVALDARPAAPGSQVADSMLGHNITSRRSISRTR